MFGVSIQPSSELKFCVRVYLSSQSKSRHLPVGNFFLPTQCVYNIFSLRTFREMLNTSVVAMDYFLVLGNIIDVACALWQFLT